MPPVILPYEGQYRSVHVDVISGRIDGGSDELPDANMSTYAER